MARRSSARVWETVGAASFRERVRYHLVRWAPLLGVAFVTYLAFPPHIGVGIPIPAIGQTAKRSVVAPFSFEVLKSPAEIAREGESRALTAQPVYRFAPSAYD
jgi:hypothetical protein